jgi:thiol-disulfide isomerase/thioredoxin
MFMPWFQRGLLCCLLVGPLAACAERNGLPEVANHPLAPGFNLADSGGQRVSAGEFAGEAMVVNFWATWCPPCLEEMPSLQRAADILAADGVHVVGIAVGEEEGPVNEYRATYPEVRFPLLLDPQTQAAQAWKVRGLPTSFIVDPQGHIRYRIIGTLEWDDPAVLKQIRALNHEAR